MYDGLNHTDTWGRDLNVAISVGFTLGVLPVKFIINPQTNFNHKMNSTKSCFMDMNGDGLPDYVTSGDVGHLTVRYNQSGKANLLKAVTNLAGGGMNMDYELSDYMGYDSPNRSQVLSSLIVYDGHAGDGADSMRYAFEYDSAYYDRFERASYGFGIVRTRSLNEDGSVYRTVTEKYSNRFYKFRNLKIYELLTDGEGNRYVEKFFTYVPKEIATGTVVNDETAFCYGENYPAINTEEVRYYEGGGTAKIVTRKHYEHGPFGNLTKYTDAGQVGVAQDSIIVTMTYFADSAGKNLTGMVDMMEARDYQNNLLRRKDCDVDYQTGQIVRLRLYNGQDTVVTDLQYDHFGHLVQAVGPANSQNERVSYRYAYDNEMHLYPVSVRNEAFGYVSTSVYDLRIGKPLSTTDINGNVMRYAYDRGGRLESILAPADTNYTLRFEYWITYGDTVHADDSPWARTSHYDIQHPDNPIQTTLICDGLGRVVQTRKDAEIDGEEMSLVSGVALYDCFGRAVREFHPFTNNVLTETHFMPDTSSGMASAMTYDILDRQTLITQPHGVRTAMTYDFGQKDGKWYFLTSATDAKQNTLTTLTDSRGLQVMQIAPGNTVTTFSYDPLGQLKSSTDPAGLTTSYQYDMLGQLTQRMHPDAGTDSYWYDAMGNMTEHTNGNGRTITYRYDHNRLTDVEYPDYPANNVHYTYGDSTATDNGKGRIVQQEDGSGWQKFSYGKLGEVVENNRTFALPFESQTYTFTMKYKYDSFNRIQQITYPDGEVVGYGYNLGGMLNKVTGSVTRRISDMVQPVSLEETPMETSGVMGGAVLPNIPPGPIEQPTVTYRYPYIDSIVYDRFEQKNEVFYGNGIHTRFTYDSLQRLAALVCENPTTGAILQNIIYSYDEAGNITCIANRAGSVSGLGGQYEGNYSYDNLYRLAAASGYWRNGSDSLPFSETMTYAANGRITQKTQNAATLLSGTRSTVNKTYVYNYSAGGNRLSAAKDAFGSTLYDFQWDVCGNMTKMSASVVSRTSFARTLTWTEDNRLQTVTDNDYFSYYQYDAGGERTYKLSWKGTTQSINGRPYIYYTPQEATLYTSPYLVVTPQGYTKHYYAEAERITSQIGRGNFSGINTPVVGDSLIEAKLQAVTENVIRPSNLIVPKRLLTYLDTLTNQQDSTSTLYFYHPDHLGSGSWITYTDGKAVQHLHYMPWGESFVDQRTTSFASRYTFSAKEKDTETGYSYFGARYYSSDLSIWLSVDPMADKYPSLSPYVYCANNPVKLVDPNGEEVWKPDVDSENNIIVRQEVGDNLASFKAFMGPAYSEEEINSMYNSMNNGVINLTQSYGGEFQLMTHALNDAQGDEEFTDKDNYNCWGAALNITSGFRLMKRTEYTSGSGIATPEDFDERLLKRYEQTSAENCSVGKTVIRYGANPSYALHGAIYMGRDKQNNEYVFTKNGWKAPPTISTVQSMLEFAGGTYGENYSIGEKTDIERCAGNGYYNKR